MSIGEIEPWAVLDEGERESVVDATGAAVRGPLASAGLRTGLRLRFDLRKAAHNRVFVGAMLEGWGGGALPTLSAYRLSADRVHGLGGPELRAGLEFGVEFGQSRARD